MAGRPGDFSDWLRILGHVKTAVTASGAAGPGATPAGGITTAPRYDWFCRTVIRTIWKDVALGATIVLVLRRLMKKWRPWAVGVFLAGAVLRIRSRMQLTLGVSAPIKTEPAVPLAEGWTDEQAALVEYLASVTYRLPAADAETVWGMGNESKQVSFTSRRYHLAFAFYAVCTVFQHKPDQKEEARRILDWLMARMLEFKSWSYARMYWPDEADPFKCSENIMWTGHVLPMAALYEALLGDCRFRTRIAALDDEGREFVTTTPELARHIAQLYRDRPHGVCCEPGLVFTMCQNHPLHGLRIEQDLHPESGCFDDVFERWTVYMLKNFGAPAGGVFQFLQINNVPLPIGHLGGDGWTFAYLNGWMPMKTVEALWYSHLRPLLDPVLAAMTDASKVDPPTGPPSKGCMCLDIPRSATAAFLFSSAAAIGDKEVTKPLCDFLCSLQRRETKGMHVAEGRDWSIACTAQLLIGLSVLRGASLRHVRNIGTAGGDMARNFSSSGELV